MLIEVSIGEVVDKTTILSIKLEKIKSPEKIANIKKEYRFLLECLKKKGISQNSPEFFPLKKINLKLWEIEDNIREKENKKEFDDEFIELARAVYITNDKRSQLKKEINLRYKSSLMEEKEYASY